MEVLDEIKKFKLQDSVVESIKALRNKTKSRQHQKYFHEILGKGVFLGSAKSRKLSIKDGKDSYKEGWRANQIYEMLIISSTMGDIVNWLNSGMKLPQVPKKLEEKINEERTEISNDNVEDRIYYLFSKKLKSISDSRLLYAKIGRILERTLLHDSYEGIYKSFMETYEKNKDSETRRTDLALQLEYQEKIIRGSLKN